MSVFQKDVIYALLALDAYNRHDDPILRKMGTPGNEPLNLQIGSALFKDSSDGLEVRGAATLTGSQLAGFSASYYTIGSETVIAYRGTDLAFDSWDHLVEFAKDFSTGWLTSFNLTNPTGLENPLGGGLAGTSGIPARRARACP